MRWSWLPYFPTPISCLGRKARLCREDTPSPLFRQTSRLTTVATPSPPQDSFMPASRRPYCQIISMSSSQISEIMLASLKDISKNDTKIRHQPLIIFCQEQVLAIIQCNKPATSVDKKARLCRMQGYSDYKQGREESSLPLLSSFVHCYQSNEPKLCACGLEAISQISVDRFCKLEDPKHRGNCSLFSSSKLILTTVVRSQGDSKLKEVLHPALVSFHPFFLHHPLVSDSI